jgi:multidrug resistance protein MdtO
MATITAPLPHRSRFTEWFPEFLKQELAPYPGRGAVVARMVIAATLTMIVIVTFRIPGGAIGTLVAFILSRENLASTAKSALYVMMAFAIGALFVPIGARMFASVPITHFIWEAVSLFIAFFLLRTLTNFALATGLSLVITNVLAIWYLPGPAERNVQLTLWQVLAALIGSMITFSVEAVFHAFSKRDELVDGITDRLETIEMLMVCYSDGRTVDPAIQRKLTQYAIVGLGGLRRYIARANFEPLRRMRMSTLVSLTGRSIDFTAALVSTYPSVAPALQERTRLLAQQIAEVRQAIATKTSLPAWEHETNPSPGTPLLSELESMVALMPAVFASENSIDPRLELLDSGPVSNPLFVPDAFSNPDHLRFVLGGTLAAMLCYILYVGLAWPGISTAVTTCVLTALSNVGASRQKQVLRIVGALLGGFVFGLGSQIFILPNIDSITGFTVLFAVVSAVAAWVATSSARLSYAGLQIVVAFYLINLSEFTIQLSLKVARDRAIGVLLGISMMWLVFERFYPRPAADQMVRIFVRNLRLMATLISATQIGAGTQAIVQIRRQRDLVYRYFGEVNAQADAVPFETGPLRAGHMAARDRIRRWQTTLRTFYLMEVPLIQFRLFGNPAGMTSAFQGIEKRFLEDCSAALNHIADRLESQLDGTSYQHAGHQSLKQLLDELEAAYPGGLSSQEDGLLRLTRAITPLIDELEAEAMAEPLFATS